MKGFWKNYNNFNFLKEEYLVKYFNQNKHLNEEGIALFVDALKLDKQAHLPQEVQNHVEDCEPCHREIIELYSAMSDISYENRTDHPSLKPNPAPKTVSIRRFLIPLATAAAILAGICFVFFNQNEGSYIDTPDVVLEEDPNSELKEAPTYTYTKEKVDSSQNVETIPNPAPRKENTDAMVKTPKDQAPKTPKIKDWKDPEEKVSSRELFAMNFIPEDELEALAEEVFRSDGITIQLPENDDVYSPKSRIPFTWDGPDQAITLIILNNKAEEVHSVELQTRSYLWRPNIDPGAYYWKLETEDDLIFVGKFFIE